MKKKTAKDLQKKCFLYGLKFLRRHRDKHHFSCRQNWTSRQLFRLAVLAGYNGRMQEHNSHTFSLKNLFQNHWLSL